MSYNRIVINNAVKKAALLKVSAWNIQKIMPLHFQNDMKEAWDIQKNNAASLSKTI
jgi:hypothetical protein